MSPQNSKTAANPKPSGKKITSYDVALNAGVSRSAVSRSFTPGAYVSDKVRKKVLAAAKELGYLPNILARGLIAGSSGLVALITGPMTSPMDSLMIESMTIKLAKQKKRALLVPITLDSPADEELLAALSYQIEAAIVFAGTVGANTVEYCTRMGTHLTLFGRYVAEAGISSVIYDNPSAADAAIRFLLRGNHRKIAYIGTRHRAFSDRERHDAASAVLAESGLHFHALGEGDYSHDSGYHAAMRLLNAMDPPDAIFASNDGMALGAVDAARELGISIPDQLAIIGLDNSPMGAWPAFQLTSWGASIDELTNSILHATFNKHEVPADKSGVHLLRVPLMPYLRATTRKISLNS